MKKSIFTIHKNMNKNKYNKVERDFPINDIKIDYEIKNDGWIKKLKIYHDITCDCYDCRKKLSLKAKD